MELFKYIVGGLLIAAGLIWLIYLTLLVKRQSRTMAKMNRVAEINKKGAHGTESEGMEADQLLIEIKEVDDHPWRPW